MAQVVRQLRPEDYEVSEKDRNVTLTEIGETHVEELLGMALRDPDRPEDISHEQARMLGYLEQALRAQFLFRRNKDYLVQAGKVVIIDEFTGRLMPGRRWSDGLHQAVEAKEGVRVESENVTYATITIQNYFRMYEKLAGMTGTALTEAEEFSKIYQLEVLAIPTNLEYQATLSGSGLVELEDRDEQGYKFRYYTHREDPQKQPVYWRRKDHPDIVYRTEEIKLRSITQEILSNHVRGRPLLVGTTSVELSERVSNRLRAEPIRRLAQVLLIRKAWFEKNNREEDGRQVPELQFLNGHLEELDVSALRKMGRDLDLSFNPEDPGNLGSLLSVLGLSREDEPRLVNVLKAGIPHQVLNARKHTEESQIIAGAGAYGAVTIATNMAGRGVDIKLGGEMADELIAAVSRVLRRAGYDDPYDMTLEERRQALLKLDPAEYGVYESEVRLFLQYLDEMEKVRVLGGLHVIGSERHEARRIDNQLRGRSARQGDPGSSRFYLSMEDELMRLFGGQQADGLMQRLKIDDAMPLEVGLVSRIVEQSQTRVEGANFDVRKHLLEYDDVLNSQRLKIYAQRNLIFMKEDLSEDVGEMLRAEVSRRVPEAMEEEEGPWKLLAWLDGIQPALEFDRLLFPSYTLRLVLDDLNLRLKQASASNEGSDGDQAPVVNTRQLLDALREIAQNAIRSEENHLLRAVNNLLDQSQDRFESQLAERLEAVDTFFEGLSLEEEEGEARTSRQILDELSGVAHFPVRLSSEQQRLLKAGAGHKAIEGVAVEVRAQVESALAAQTVARLLGSVERRLEESLELNQGSLPLGDWDALSEAVLDRIHQAYERRIERFLGNNGQILADLTNALGRYQGGLGQHQLLALLVMMTQGARATFDKKTHRRVYQRTNRLNYVYYAAQLLEGRSQEEISQDVLEHLERARISMQRAWGIGDWRRLSASTMVELDEKAQNGLQAALGEETYARVSGLPLQSLDEAERDVLILELGRQALTEVYRQLLLAVITELWVDYLTQMEALRVSIGLEAYGQRDPLVQYKSRASGLFQNLLNEMRSGVVSRMFTYRPRDLSAVQAGVGRAEAGREETSRLEGDGGDGRPESVPAGDGAAAYDEAGAAEEEAGEEAEAAGVSAPAQNRAKDDRPGGGKKRRRRRR
jgi:preprotein translocase subunit SecA